MRPGRELLLETVLPELSIVLPEGDGPVDPHIWFPAAPKKVWLEIGFGAGEHLAWQAAENPDVGMVGAEPYLNGVARLLSEIIERDLQNICLLADHGKITHEGFELALTTQIHRVHANTGESTRKFSCDALGQARCFSGDINRCLHAAMHKIRNSRRIAAAIIIQDDDDTTF